MMSNTIHWTLITWLLAITNDVTGLEIPQFVVEPQSAVVLAGSMVYLNCSTRPPASSIRWLLNGTQLVTTATGGKRRQGNGASFELVAGDVTSSVRIMSFNASWHEGYYQCVAMTPAGTLASREAKLEVATLGSFEVSRPGQEVVTSIVGNVAVIPCPTVPTSKPSAIIEFQFNGVILPLTSPRHVIVQSTGNLHIANVTQADRGVYQCLAYNSVTEIRLAAPVSYRLVVNGPPGSDSMPSYNPGKLNEQMTVVLGNDLFMECSAEGWPVPQLTWEKYGGHLPNGRYTTSIGNLLIKDVHKYDAGTYLCKANNSAGQPPARVVSVEVVGPPVVEAVLPIVNSTEGRTVVLRCRVQGSPKLTTRWLHNGTSLVTGGQAISLRDTSLTLANIQTTNAGIYQCFARNHIGSAFSSIKLQVSDEDQRETVASSVHPSNAIDYEGEDEGGVIDVTSAGSADRHREGPDSERVRHGGTRHSVDQSGKSDDKGSFLLAPSRPEVSKVTETTVLVQWTVAPSSAPHITSFRLQFKELLDERSAIWQTVDEDIAPAWRSYEVTELRLGRSYRFRVVAIYANSESRHSPMSIKLVTDASLATPPKSVPPPVIVEVRPLNINEIFIGWQVEPDRDQQLVDGFFIYYAPFNDDDSLYEKQLVLGSTVRHAVLSHLGVATPYSIRMTSFNDHEATESDFSNTVVRATMSPAEARNSAAIVPVRDDADAAIVVPHTRNAQRQPNSVPRGGSRLTTTTTTTAPAVSMSYTPSLSSVGDSSSSLVSMDGDLLLQPPLSGIEEYVSETAPSENQLLYVVLGTVLGVVVLVTVVCIAMCMWKQQQHQRHSFAVKQQKLMQHNAVVAMTTPGPSAAFSGKLMSSCTVASSAGGRTNSKYDSTHVPGCTGGCNGDPTTRGNRAGSLLRDVLPPGNGIYANAQTATLGRKKVVPESSSLLMSNSASCTPSLGFGARIYNEPYSSSNMSSVADKMNCSSVPYNSPVYTRLPSDLDLSQTGSGSPGVLRMPTPQYLPYPSSTSGLHHLSPQQQHHIATSTNIGRQSPDHIPRSHERNHPPTGVQQPQPGRSPYWAVDPARQTRLSSSGAGGSTNGNGNAPAVQLRKQPPLSGLEGGETRPPGGAASSYSMASSMSAVDHENLALRGGDGVMRDMGTNTDFASEAGTLSLGYGSRRLDVFDPVQIGGGGSRRDSFGSETVSLGTSVIRDSFLSTDSPPPLTTPGLFFDFPDHGLRIDSLLPVAASCSNDVRRHPPLAITSYWADGGSGNSWSSDYAQQQQQQQQQQQRVSRVNQPEIRH